jgi:tetratricopeptide (TPR) repeat protein
MQRQFPDFVGAWVNASVLLSETGRLEEALAMAERAMEVDDQDQSAIFALLVARIKLGLTEGDFDELYDKSLSMELTSETMLIERGALRMQALDMLGAEADFRAALGAGLDNDFARLHLAIALQLQGRYLEAWPCYSEGAALGARYEPPDNTKPRWNGQPMPGRTLMVFTYFHGFGDAILFARYLPAIKAMTGGRVLLSVYEPLLRLLDGLPGMDGLFVQEKESPPYDAFITILELPIILRMDPSTVPPPTELRLPDAPTPPVLDRDGFKVGLVWAGNPVHTNDARRSASPRLFDALADIPSAERISWYGLQLPPDPEPPRLPNFMDMSPYMGDFLDTAQIVKHLDLLVSVDTATVHVAGSLRVPTILLLPFMPEWRWGMGESTHWYGSVKLLRQPARNWESVVGPLKAEIGRRMDTDWKQLPRLLGTSINNPETRN